jgi:hypothetical protein
MFEHEIRMENASPDDGVRWSHELQASGLIQDQDYVWQYVPTQYDNFGLYNSAPKVVVFAFDNPALATFYQLKWQPR